MSLLDACRRTGRRTFGIERLRPEQESAMLAILDGRNVLVASDGFGKSLIYQVPAMILKRPTIVVSPLIALMADRNRPCGERIHQECRERDQCACDVIVAIPTGSWCQRGSRVIDCEL